LPLRTRRAIEDVVNGQVRAGVLGTAPIEKNLPGFRDRVGRFIGGARGEEIAFLRNTGDGANVIALGLDWRSGDEVVLCDNEFGANALPWVALRERGVVVRFIHAPRERMSPEVLSRDVGPRTRIVALSWVSFTDGYRHDLAALAGVAHDAGAFFCVDGIQALGAFPIDVKAWHIDALYAGGAKWLLALAGVSFLYLDAALQERLTVRWRGWRDVADIWNFLDYDQPLAPGAARFEGGTPNFLGVAAMAASMDLIEESGVPRIEAHVVALTDRLVAGLRELGAEVASERGPGISSGIVTFRLPENDPVALGRRLSSEGFITTYRESGIRVSPHGHNTEADIDAFLARLR
jgi:selenocysteine lyase/cysteine desulfurase